MKKWNWNHQGRHHSTAFIYQSAALLLLTFSVFSLSFAGQSQRKETPESHIEGLPPRNHPLWQCLQPANGKHLHIQVCHAPALFDFLTFNSLYRASVSHQASHFETLHFFCPQNLDWNGEGKVLIGPARHIHHRGKSRGELQGLSVAWVTTMVSHLNLTSTHTHSHIIPPHLSHIKYLKPAAACRLEAV